MKKLVVSLGQTEGELQTLSDAELTKYNADSLAGFLGSFKEQLKHYRDSKIQDIVMYNSLTAKNNLATQSKVVNILNFINSLPESEQGLSINWKNVDNTWVSGTKDDFIGLISIGGRLEQACFNAEKKTLEAHELNNYSDLTAMRTAFDTFLTEELI